MWNIASYMWVMSCLQTYDISDPVEPLSDSDEIEA